MKLETEHGVFEGTTEAEVLRLARAAKSTARKLEAAKDADRDLAYSRAYVAGYKLYSAALRETGPHRTWRLFDPTAADCPDHIKHRVVRLDGHLGDSIAIDTENGCAPIKFHNCRCVGVLENGGGWTVAIVLNDLDNKDLKYFYAVGVAGESVALADIYGIDPKIFIRKDQ